MGTGPIILKKKVMPRRREGVKGRKQEEPQSSVAS